MFLRRALPVLLTALSLGAAAMLAPAPAMAVPPANAPAAQLSWQVLPTGVADSVRFRGLAVVSADVVWAGGYDGVILRTVDGGASWTSVGPADAAGMQFRDIEATSARHAVAMSAGEGEDSRIYVTDDGGASWSESFRNHEAAAFYDCMAFSSPTTGLAASDPVDGKTRMLQTRDGGHTWSVLSQAGMVAALAGEYYFAGSGTCLSALPGRTAYLGTGGAGPWARVLTTADSGVTWTAVETPVAASASAGIFSVQFADPRRGVVVGGDFADPTNSSANAAWTADGGRTWSAPAVPPRGYRSGSDWLGAYAAAIVAVGPTGSDVSWNGGRTWSAIADGSLDTVACTAGGVCFASGAAGVIARLEGARH